MTELFIRLVDPSLMVRRITVVADDLHPAEESKTGDAGYEQPDLFSVLAADGEPQDAVAVGQVGDRRNDGVRRGTDDSGGRPGNAGESAATRERDIQQTLLDVKRKFGRNCRHQGDEHGTRRHRPTAQPADRRARRMNGGRHGRLKPHIGMTTSSICRITSRGGIRRCHGTIGPPSSCRSPRWAGYDQVVAETARSNDHDMALADTPVDGLAEGWVPA